MKRTITDFFAPAATKKPKLEEPPKDLHTHAVPPIVAPNSAAAASSAPPAQTNGVVSNNSMDEGLTLEQKYTIEKNRKQALARKLFSKITEPSWREALAGGTHKDLEAT